MRVDRGFCIEGVIAESEARGPQFIPTAALRAPVLALCRRDDSTSTQTAVPRSAAHDITHEGVRLVGSGSTHYRAPQARREATARRARLQVPGPADQSAAEPCNLSVGLQRRLGQHQRAKLTTLHCHLVSCAAVLSQATGKPTLTLADASPQRRAWRQVLLRLMLLRPLSAGDDCDAIAALSARFGPHPLIRRSIT